MKAISIIVPVFNESESLFKLAEALKPLIDNELTPEPYVWEVLLINDGSIDNSLDVMRELHRRDSRFSFINLSRNFGKEAAMLAGLDFARGNAAIIMDADLQHPVSAIPDMLAKWNEGFDDVYGRRITRGKESWLRKYSTALFYRLLQSSTKIDILPNVGDFRLFDRKCIDALRSMRESQRYSKGLFAWIGFRKTDVEFIQSDRIAGQSSFTMSQLLRLAIEGITGFSTAPLRFASVMGIFTAAAALLYLIWTIFKTLIYGDPVAGYPTLMCVILFLGSCQLIALGIIGEYIAKIFAETKHRPVYLVESQNDTPLL